MSDVIRFMWPMPITINRAYAWSKKSNKRVTSSIYKMYKVECSKHFMANRGELKRAFYEIRNKINRGEKLILKCTFYFKSCFNNDGSVKILDVSNRIKVLEDMISKYGEFDDKHFFGINVVKENSPNGEDAVMVEVY